MVAKGLKALDRKMFRDLWKIRGQALAICLVLSAGVAMFVMSTTAMVSLSESKDVYYDRFRFADLFSDLRRAPRSLEPRIKAIPGVAQIHTRISFPVVLNLEHFDRPVTAQLISLPERGEPRLNHLHLRRGRWVEPFHPDEVLISEAFALAHQLNPGDVVTAVMNGRLRQLQIVGVAISPEFIIQVRPGELLPDNRRFGIIWTGEQQLEAVFDMKQAFNQVFLKTEKGANQDQILEQLDQLLADYGSLGGYRREHQISHQFISDEIRQLQATALIAPAIFLFVAAFLLNIVFSRMLNLQREQIAALKAFGYSNTRIAVHFLKMVLLITSLGVLIGSVCGMGLGHSLTRLYAQFFKFPDFSFRVPGWSIVGVTLLALLATLLGTMLALYRGTRIPPAEAMRPEPPENFQASFIERWKLTELFPGILRILIRKMERHKLKTGLNILGIGLAIASLIAGGFSLDAVTYMMDFQFRQSQRQDLTLTLFEPDHQRVAHSIKNLPGVLTVEPFRSIPVRIRHEHRSRRLGILGLPVQSELYCVYDDRNQILEIPPTGLVLSEKLSRILQVQPGQSVEVEVLSENRATLQLPVTGVIREYQGLNAYMQIDALNQELRRGPLISGAFLKIDQNRQSDFFRQVKQTPALAGLSVKRMAIESFEATLAENLMIIRGFNIFFAALIAFGVVYNATRISLSEQSRDLATMRVLGFTRLEVSLILLGELAMITLAAIPLGCLIGYGFAAIVIQGLDTELYRIPLVIFPRTYAYAVVTVILATLVSGLIVRRKLDDLDLVAVLKAKE
jgi:putative ABC transport system permease protein